MKRDLEFLIGMKLKNLKIKDLECCGQIIGKDSLISLIQSPYMPGWQYDFETNLVKVDKGNFHCEFDFNFLNLYGICKRFEKYKPAPIVIEIKQEPQKPIVKIKIQKTISKSRIGVERYTNVHSGILKMFNFENKSFYGTKYNTF